MTDHIHSEQRLESWKAIAAYLNRDVRTVRRWEASEGLPVHRHRHLTRSTVYAFASELDAWRAGRRSELPPPPASLASSGMHVVAIAVVALTALMASGHDSVGGAVSAQGALGQTVRAIWTGSGVDPMGSPSADGRYLSYTDWTTGDLAIRDLEAHTSRRLTSTGGWETSGDYAEFSSLSPDGQQVVYAWFVDRGDDLTAKTCRCRYELRVMQVAGAEAGKSRVVMRGDDGAFWVRPAAWMPDGQSIVVARTVKRGVNELGIVSLADGGFRLIRPLGPRMADHFSLAPDGRHIALAVAEPADSSASDIALVDVTSGSQVPLVVNPADDRSPVFTPDGSSVLFISDRTSRAAVWRIPLAGDKPSGPPVMVASIPDGSGMLGTLRNGSLYYFSGGNSSDLFVADLDGAGNQRSEPVMAIERFVNGNNTPVFSPDGQRLAYYSRRGTAMGRTALALMVHTFSTGQDREVPLTIEPIDGLSWFPDGGAVLVTTRDDARTAFQFHRVDIRTGESSLVASSGRVATGLGLLTRRPLVSPDGGSIVFADDPADVEAKGPGAMLLRRFDLQSRQTITIARTASADQYITSFAISRDGRDIALMRVDLVNRNTVLEIVSSAGGVAREVFREPSIGRSQFTGLEWTPDKRYVLFAHDGGGNLPGAALWKVPADGGPAAATGITASGRIRFPTISPDGSRIVYAVGGEVQPVVWSLENFLSGK